MSVAAPTKSGTKRMKVRSVVTSRRVAPIAAPPAMALATPPTSPAPASSATVAMSTEFASGRFRLIHLHAAALGEHHLVQQLHQRIDGFDRWRRRIGELRHLQDRADQRLGLER